MNQLKKYQHGYWLFVHVACDYTKCAAGVTAGHIFAELRKAENISRVTVNVYIQYIWFTLNELGFSSVLILISAAREVHNVLWSLVRFDPFWTAFPLALATFLFLLRQPKDRKCSHPVIPQKKKKTNRATVPPRAAQNQFLFGPHCDICFSECCCGWRSQRKL